MNQQSRQSIIVIAILVILIALGAASGKLAKNTTTDQIPGTTSTAPTSQVTKTISIDGQDGKNVLDVLRQNHQVETTDSSFGTFVKSVDGTAQTENSFWLFYVDGQPATQAADKTDTHNGQKIEWRYETIQSQ